MRAQILDDPRPAPQLSAVWKGVLSQDVITTAAIPVDSSSRSPVAVFTNKANAEALAIVNMGQGRQLCHVARDSGSDSGWHATPLFGGRPAQQVVAGVAYPGTSEAAVFGLFLDEKTLHATSLATDGLWSAPKEIGAAPMAAMRMAYSPQGRLVVHGATAAGNLITAYQPTVGGAFTIAECDTSGALTSGDFQLCMTDEESWTIVANIDGKAVQITGVLGEAKPASRAPAHGFAGGVKHVVLGYWNGTQNALVFLIVGSDDALHVWSQGQGASTGRAQKIPNGSSISQATGHVAEDGSLHVYAVDGDERLWVLHQSSRQPWRDDGTPNWLPMLALDSGVAKIVGELNPMAPPALFGLSAGDYSLRLHTLDPGSRLWKSDRVLQRSSHAFEVARFRTEVSVLEGNGRPVPRHPVTLKTEKGASKADVWAAGAVHTVDENGVRLETDVTGKLTFAVLATDGLACPHFLVESDRFEKPILVEPAGETHRYLAGEIERLHPTNPGGALPRFDADGRTLQNATVNGTPLVGSANGELVGVAAKAIRGAAAVAVNPAKLASDGVHGFAGSLNNDAPTFHTFNSVEQLHAHKLALRTWVAAGPQGAFDVGAFIGDIFEGIKNGVIAIVDFVVDVANKTADLIVKIGKWVQHVADLALEGLEKIGAFIAGVFHAIEAAIEKVVDWLKALFDFSAIWRTKMALEQGLLAVPRYVSGMAREGQKSAHAWFGNQKTAVNHYFDEMKRQYAGKSFGEQPGWQNPGAPSTTPIAGDASAADCTNNTHHNWLHDKVSSYATNESFFTPKPPADDPWGPFAECLTEAGQEFGKAKDELLEGIMTTLKDPSTFATVAVPLFIEMIKDLVDAGLDLCDAAAQAMLALAITSMEALESLLAAELPLGFLNTLWQWIAEQAGYKNDGKLTAAALISLVAAFPATLVYKLVKGVEHEPFPEGRLPLPVSAGGLGAGQWPKACREISCILRIIQFFPSSVADALGPASPMWLTLVGLGFSAAIWFLAHGFPELDALVWAVGAGAATTVLWMAGCAALVLWEQKVLQPVIGAKNDIVAVGDTVLGAVSMAFGIVQIVTDKLPPSRAVSNILSPMDSLFDFLNLTVIRNSPVVGEFAIAGKIVFDLVGCIGGGATQLIAVLESKDPAWV